MQKYKIKNYLVCFLKKKSNFALKYLERWLARSVFIRSQGILTWNY